MTPGPSNVAVKSSAASKVMWGHLRFVRWEINDMARFPHTPTNTSVMATTSWTVLGTTNIFGWEKLRGSSAWRSFQSQAVLRWLWSTLVKEQKVELVLVKIWLQKSVKNAKRSQKQKPISCRSRTCSKRAMGSFQRFSPAGLSFCPAHYSRISHCPKYLNENFFPFDLRTRYFSSSFRLIQNSNGTIKSRPINQK